MGEYTNKDSGWWFSRSVVKRSLDWRIYQHGSWVMNDVSTVQWRTLSLSSEYINKGDDVFTEQWRRPLKVRQDGWPRQWRQFCNQCKMKKTIFFKPHTPSKSRSFSWSVLNTHYDSLILCHMTKVFVSVWMTGALRRLRYEKNGPWHLIFYNPLYKSFSRLKTFTQGTH